MIIQDRNRLAYTGRINASDRDFYGTPPEWIDAARQVMGSIELDPASCELANQYIVHADDFYDEEANALVQSWEARTLFLNPPYSGRLKKAFARKFYEEWSTGCIGQAIILVNNATETEAFDMFSRCSKARAEPRKRIQFVGVDGRCQEHSNTRGQVFFYCGTNVRRFKSVFLKMGCRVLMGA